jgi:regulator of sirC expression with transglutaminase-like and TPR domain
LGWCSCRDDKRKLGMSTDVGMTADPYEEFRQVLDRPDAAIDLTRAALVIARSDYPKLDIGGYMSRLDQLSIKVSRRLGSDPDGSRKGSYRSIAALNHVLFDEEGYHGNTDDYFNPKNSFLNEVMDLKRGIPITLSVLYMEIGRRIGLRLQGVGFPGHFLVKYSDDKGEIIIDPFNRGEIRSLASLEELLQQLYGGKIAFYPSLLKAVSKKQILQRMLNNLKAVYLKNNDLLKGLSISQRLLILEPNSPEDVRDRGILYLKLECFNQALDDFERYLRFTPEADDAGWVRERVLELKKQVRQIH